MSDFSQHGLITTLQRLSDQNAAQLESELEKLAHAAPIALVLPCHACELGQPALEHLIDEISGAKFLREIVISMNGLDERTVKQAREIFARLPQRHRILRNDSPAVAALCERRMLVADAHRAPLQQVGKGANVWSALGLLAREGRCRLVALLDCDVTTFRRDMLVRLCYACAHPELNYAFAKMYYSRVTDRIYGRVSRLFLAPLLQALVRVSGHQPLLDFLLSFRYPLAGECALRLDLAAALPLDSGWGLEIGFLCEVFRHASSREICQVDGGSHYDHRHQALDSGLFKMSKQIALTLLDQLAAEGFAICENYLGTMQESYRLAAQEALTRYQNLALINGLAFHHADEISAIDSFAQALDESCCEFLAGPLQHSLPAWNEVFASAPKNAVTFLESLAIDDHSSGISS